MRSPTTAVLWEIWRQHRWTVAVIAGLTVAGRFFDFFERRMRTAAAGADPPPLTDVCGMLAFLLLFAVFNYTDSSGGRGLGRFPRRLFTLPVSSLRLVAVPMLAAIASVELLYLLWMEPLSRGGSANALFVALLLAVFMVFYLAALWTLERAGSLRLVLLGVIASAVFAIGVLPSFPPAPPPPWRSELVLAALVAGGALVAFLLAWQHVARLRSGGSANARRLESLIGWISIASAPRRRAFKSPAAAHFWFEWRCSGIVLPALVAGVILVVIMPMSWLVRSDAVDTFRLLLAVLVAPVVLAVPVGIAFSKPTFWSEDLAVPAFVAVRPLRSEDLVAIKVKVAAVSAGIAFDAGRLPGWLLGDPARFAPVVTIAAVTVIAKYWLAAYAWRGVAPRYLRVYLLIWLAGTAAFLALGIVVWGIVRIYLPLDVDRLRSVVVLLALLAVPLARVGLAPSSLARNRHR